MNILLVDAGNSRTKWGFHANGQWQEQGWTPSAQQQLTSQWKELPTPEKIIVSNVAGINAAQGIANACNKWETAPHVVRAERHQCGVENGYASPRQLGSDRWAALIAARHLFPERDVLVVQLGTAVTIDQLSADGRFRGGLILPGTNLMLDALARNTDGLVKQNGKVMPHPDNTADAMFSGAAFAIAGAIEHSFRQLTKHPICLLSGGDVDILLPLLTIPVHRVDHLVLEGLLRIALEI